LVLHLVFATISYIHSGPKNPSLDKAIFFDDDDSEDGNNISPDKFTSDKPTSLDDDESPSIPLKRNRAIISSSEEEPNNAKKPVGKKLRTQTRKEQTLNKEEVRKCSCLYDMFY
jgi:hypothetical protein